MNKRYVVTVHGVGDSGVGETARSFAAAFGKGMSSEFEHQELVLGDAPNSHETAQDPPQEEQVVEDVSYAHFVPSLPEVPHLVEVNWADVQRPKRTVFGTFGHLVRLMVAMLYIADRWHNLSPRPRDLLTPYRWLVEAVTGWQILFGIYVMYLASYVTPSPTEPRIRWWILLVGFALVLGATAIMWSWSVVLRNGGIFWSIAFFWVGLYACLNPEDPLRDVVEITTRAHSLALEILALAMVLVLVLVLGFQRRELTREQKFTRLALAYLPVIAISLVGSLAWMLSLPMARTGTGYTGWEETYLGTLGYNLRHIEWAMAWELGLIGLLVLAGAVIYCGRRWFDPKAMAGMFAQDWFSYTLYAMPVVLLIVPFVNLYDSLGWDFLWWKGTRSNATGGDVMETYALSALRITPYLAFFITPMGAILDIAGDIAFFLLPRTHPLSLKRNSVKQGALRRVELLIDHLLKDDSTSEVIVVAHSQGSVLAIQALGERPSTKVKLITMGSPIDSLYSRFLGWKRSGNDPSPWTNYYRLGDYIGGEITGIPNEIIERNQDPMRGGHIHYWSDSVIVAAVKNSISPYKKGRRIRMW